MHQVLETLFQVAPDLPPKLKNAAKVILDNPNLVGGVTPLRLAMPRIDVVATRFGLSRITLAALFNLGGRSGAT